MCRMGQRFAELIEYLEVHSGVEIPQNSVGCMTNSFDIVAV
jgi:hypothetical protein